MYLQIMLNLFRYPKTDDKMTLYASHKEKKRILKCKQRTIVKRNFTRTGVKLCHVYFRAFYVFSNKCYLVENYPPFTLYVSHNNSTT